MALAFCALLVWTLAARDWVLSVLAVVLIGWALSEWWRRLCVTGSQLIAQGRLARRRVPLTEITQIGATRGGRLWVSRSSGASFYLRMAAPSAVAYRLGPDGMVAALRERAKAGGAQLGPRLPVGAQPPSPCSPLFSL